MNRMKIAAVVLVALLAALLSGCLAKYSFSFLDEEDFVNGQGAWYHESLGHSFEVQGLWLKHTQLTAPYAYKGDFTCTYEFYANTTLGSSIDWMYFVLVNAKWQDEVPVEKFFGFTIHRYGDKPEYSVWQGAATWDIYNINTDPPGMINGAVNTVEVKKTGNVFSVRMNGNLLHTMTMLTANDTTYWYPAIYGAYDFLLPYGFFIRKFTIEYTKGNELEAEWAF
jgi:hypothetical protein